MQAQAHISGQVSGEAGGQLSGLMQQNGGGLPSQASNIGVLRRPWHADRDVNTARQCIWKKILQLFQRRQISQDWQQRLPDFVRRLEDGLYKEAATKEEYMDFSTLEQRLQALAKRIAPSNRNQSFAAHASSSVGTMIPTPGMSNAGNGSSMMAATGGGDISMMTAPNSNSVIPNPVGMGSMLPSSSGSDQVHSNTFMTTDGSSNKTTHAPVLGNNIFSNSGDNLSSLPGPLGNMLQPQQGVGGISMGTTNQIMPTMGMSGIRNQMIPTPGLGTSQSMSMKAASSGGMGYSNVDYMAAAQQQQFTGGQNNHIYHSMSGQISVTVGSNMQRKNSSYGFMNGGMNSGMPLMGNNQHLMNGTTSLSNTGGYINASQYGNLQMTSRQHVTQQRQQPFMQSMPNQMAPLAGDGYAMNAADLAGGGSFYNPASSGGLATASNVNGNSLGIQSTKMIPVPGLASQQQKLAAHQQGQLNQSQGLNHSQQMNFPHSSSVVPRGQLLQSQQQQHLQQFQQHQHPQQQHPHQQQLHQYQQPHPQQLHSQQQMQHGQQQQQLSLKTKGVQQNWPESTFFEQKQAGTESHQEEASQQETSEQNQFLLTPSQQQQLPVKDSTIQHSQVLHDSSNSQHSDPQQSEKLQELQVLSPQEQQQTQSSNDLTAQILPEAGLKGDQGSQSQEKLQLPQQVPSTVHEKEPHQQVEQQQVPGQDKPQQHQLPEVSANGMVSTVTSQTRIETSAGDTVGNGQPSGNAEARQLQYIKQQRWLLFLRHASKCSAAEGQCQTPHCSTAQQLWAHITKCHDRECLYPRCHASRTLLSHHQRCRDRHCPVCGPVRHLIMQQRAMGHAQSAKSGVADFGNVVPKSSNSNITVGINASLPSRSGTSMHDTTQIPQPPLKRAKIEPTSPSCAQQQVKIPQASVLNPGEIQVASQMQPSVCQQSGQGTIVVKSEDPKSVKAELVPVKMEQSVSSQHGACQSSKETCANLGAEHGQMQGHPVKAEHISFALSKVPVQVKQEHLQFKQETIPAMSPSDMSASAKSGKPKIKGVSLTELFTPEQIREHITGLRQWVGQSKAKAEKNQAMEHQMSENSCQLCAVEKLTFEPPPIYCTPCGVRIKRNAPFYTVGSGDTRHYFCIPCYNDIRGDSVKVDGLTFFKSRLEKRKNDEETEEAWVQCDKCEAWQHQICALFNGRRNEGGQAEYTCPNCYTMEIERGERKPLPQSAVLGAKDLPRTYLSDHIEQRLSRRLKQEKQERARALGKSYEEVPGAEALVVRVVSSVDKKLEVKQRFLEIFQHEDYPTEYPYKSKVLLLFQKIEGVEVCLFGMYVQEFGSECSHPNQRRVYLSYLDSVKYFRPDVKTVTGEALRTFVYHEILIGYLEYCKKRGLTSCYIWACPPLKGEDYILYCHPEIQKTPKSDKLREWYLTMLRKASKENIVVDMTNLYDYFFVSTGECKTKVTAARLPYFDGDYWPGAAEDMILQLQQEEEDGRKQQKTKKTATKRASKAAAQAELASNASKDALLMQKLGESIHPMKDDFIMVHLQHACTHCCLFIVSGKRWVCSQCKNFQLCDKCYEADQKLDERDRHPINNREKHLLSPIEVTDVPVDTKDNDDIMESEFFDTRQAFLSLCQGNHYQYDTLRRAKHSSMMVLYHLHNPTAPAFVTTCNMCHHDIETGQGWRCETCPDFDICNACYQKDDFVKHPHKLTPHPSMADRDAQNQEARQQRVLQLRKMLDLLVHASQCRSSQCLYPNCRRVKGLFRHGMQCGVRASGGCPLCKKMWYLLQLHARACKESECRVPRCKDLKEHLRRLQHQMESRRRAAVMEMMRQRAAEVAGNSH
eukprot:Gb_02923 [translate_table: standard]